MAALERVDPTAAQAAYSAALQVWPDDRTLLLGAGNTAYALGQSAAAVNAYRAAMSWHADFAEAWNNLAQVLLEQGQRQEASQAIAMAVALGGPRFPQYLKLQLGISKNRVLTPVQ